MNDIKPRQPKGTPTGGQFAASEHPEADGIRLGGHDAGDSLVLPDGSGAVPLLAPSLTPNQERSARIDGLRDLSWDTEAQAWRDSNGDAYRYDFERNRWRFAGDPVPTALPNHSPFAHAHSAAMLESQWEVVTSPENLYCDGEISPAQAEATLRRYTAEYRTRLAEIEKRSA